MKHGSLFSGYGGLDMAIESALGAETVWVSDVDKGACKVLTHHYPDVPNVGDVTAVDWTQVEPVDVISGGSPCQDISHAGRRAGMTDGTRSNLWVAMREAIATIRPTFVVWENVGGSYSAQADSDVEPCAGCVGDGSGVHLRALGRVLGDLASLGFDAEWRGIRAADVGAPHGRRRVFVLAWAADPSRHTGRDQHGDGGAAANAGGEHGLERRIAASGQTSRGGPLGEPAGRDRAPLSLLPTPVTQPTTGNGHARHLGGEVKLLPTPAVNDMGEGKTVGAWDEWTDRMRAKHGNGNGHGASLAIEAQRLLPTPRATDGTNGGPNQRGSSGDLMLPSAVQQINYKEDAYAVPAKDRSREDLRDLRDGADTQEVCEWAPRGQDGVPQAKVLLAELREHASSDPGRLAPLACPPGRAESPVHEVRDDGATTCASHRSRRDEQRPNEPDGSVRVMPPAPPLARGRTYSFGPYEEAVQRWEAVLGRAAPPPVEPTGRGGSNRLSPRLTEFLMGLPDGWITDVPGVTRNEALKLCGNGVVPQQAYAALTDMLAAFTREVAA